MIRRLLATITFVIATCVPILGQTCDPQAPVCGAQQFCQLPYGQCSSTQGSCTSIPDSCIFDYDPVCGCDGHTYFNLCDAQQSQMSIRYLGECSPPVETCGGPAGTQCSSSKFCEAPFGECSSDVEGTCRTVPSPSSCFNLDCQQVCGCDGVTYWSSCDAYAIRMSLLYPAPCFTGGGQVTGVRFGPQGLLTWDPIPGALAYNVYRKEMRFSPPRDSGSCYRANLTQPQTTITDLPGDWPLLFDVSAVFATGEGPLGRTGWCTDRVPLVRCPAP
jgi:Kazal-type serine protease inhibitor-like protein